MSDAGILSVPTQASILSHPQGPAPATRTSTTANLRNPMENIVRMSEEKIAAHYIVARRPVGLPADDSRHLRDAGRVSVGCFPQPACTLEPHLVHGVVQHCARRNNGSTIFGELRAHRTPLGRRPGAICCSGCPRAPDATRCGSKALLSRDRQLKSRSG